MFRMIPLKKTNKMKKENNNMMIEIHMLKSFPPTNLNRDDTGSPKSCVFGGVQRGRISSQCLKRAWRTSDVFKEGPIGRLGIRTRKMPEIVSESLRKQGADDMFADAVVKLLSGFGNKEGKVKEVGITQQIVFYAQQEIDVLAERFMQMHTQGKTATDIGKIKAPELQSEIGKAGLKPITLDIALFGRMVTSDAFADVEAAMQVAHAISTHKVSLESDYFTAVDDLVNGDESDDAGAGMIGDIEYNACCYYLYACVDIDQLKENLRFTPDRETIVKAAVPAIIETMAFTNPSGKQNTFAGHSLPAAIMVEKKNRKIPVNYANAFVKPACALQKQSLVENSVLKLADEVNQTDRKFGLEVTERLWLDVTDYTAPGLAYVCASLPEMLEKVDEMVRG